MTPRETSFALISAWIHKEPAVPCDLLPKNEEACQEQCLDLSMIAASLLNCWANEAGIPPHVLLTDLALGQAIENTSPLEEGDAHGA